MPKKLKYICNHIIFCDKVGSDVCSHSKPHQESGIPRIKGVNKKGFVLTEDGLTCTSKRYHQKCWWAGTLGGRQCIRVEG